MKRKILIMGVLTLGLFTVNKITASAVELTAIDGTVITDENRSEYMCKNPYGDMIFPDNLEYDGQKISLFCEYEDEESAMDNFISKNQEILSYVENKHSIESLNKNNLEKYNEYIILILDERNLDEDLLKQADNFTIFFGLYEDKYRNEEIIETVNTMKRQRTNYKDDLLANKLNGLTPYYSEKLELESNIVPYVVSGLNKSDATAYAKKWARSYNTSKYKKYEGKDCTNFVSQILEAGGISQNNTGDPSTGWWHEKNGIFHKNSVSWTSASTFATYWGVTYSSFDIKGWADSLYEGDIVAFDKNKDGLWDHLGYVTERGTPMTASAQTDTMSVKFRDIRIAQHSSNYENWISSDENGWENGFGTWIYGKIR